MSKKDEINEKLSELKNARKKVLEAQSYTIGSRSVTRASLAEINKEIKRTENELAQELGKGSRRRVVVIDG